MRSPKALPAAIVAFALVLGLAACGGSSSPSSEKSTTTKASSGGSDEATTTKATDSGSDSGDDPSTTVVATGGGKFCDNLAAYINDSSMTDITSAEGYKQAIEDAAAKGKELLSQAPDELSDSVQTLLAAQDQVLAALEKVDFDVTKLSPEDMSAVESPEVEAAGKKLDAYVTDTCGIDIPKTTAATIPDMTTLTMPG